MVTARMIDRPRVAIAVVIGLAALALAAVCLAALTLHGITLDHFHGVYGVSIGTGNHYLSIESHWPIVTWQNAQ